jgi:hypothetical protein
MFVMWSVYLLSLGAAAAHTRSRNVIGGDDLGRVHILRIEGVASLSHREDPPSDKLW